MYVSLSMDGRWRRRYLALYPICDESSHETERNTNTMKDVNRPQILIYPRQTAKTATARIRLTSSHGIQHRDVSFYGRTKDEEWKLISLFDADDDDKESGSQFIFKLIKRDKTTLYIKVGTLLLSFYLYGCKIIYIKIIIFMTYENITFRFIILIYVAIYHI